jgi:hypothetical protein
MSAKNNNSENTFIGSCVVVVMGIIVIGVIALILWYNPERGKNNMNSYVLGEATQCGYIGVKIAYDKEPVDVRLYSPDGRQYTKDSPDVSYDVSENENYLTLLADSDELGMWSVEFNTKTNKSIDYTLIQEPSETLYLSHPSLYADEEGYHHLVFSTSISDTENVTAKCSLILNKPSFSYQLYFEDVELNKEVDIRLEFPKHVFTDEDYTMKINVSTDDNRHAIDEITIHLNGYEEPISETQTEDE